MRLIEKLKQMAARAGSEIVQEGKRQLVQGRAELGSALFSGSNAYVPYGQGQQVRGAFQGMEGFRGNGKPEMQQENDGRSM